MNRNFLIGVFVLLAVLVVGFLVYNQDRGSSNKLKVMASFYPLQYFASEVGGSRVEVVNVTPAGSEPHDYEPTPQDVAKLQDAKLVIVNGAGLEPWFDKIKEALKGKVVIASEGLDLKKGVPEEGEEDTGDMKDPHVWLNPILAKSLVDKILAGFVSADPGNKTVYEQNAQNLKERLDTLDQSFREGLTTCIKKDFITSHAAFAYLASQYGLNQVSISGISPEEEPSAQQLAEVADFARKNDVKYIFFETLVSPKLSETIASEIGAKTLVLDPIEGLSDDDITQGKNYFTVMESNLNNLQTALECK
jgi:zinc transport system substrate-binding protein